LSAERIAVENHIETLLRADGRAMKQLEAVRLVCPEGTFLAAGFVRNRVWDALYDPAPRVPEVDVDVVYYCTHDTGKARDLAVEAVLQDVDPTTDWQVRNQARMHTFGGHAPFTSLGHALMHWAETATSVGVRLDGAGDYHFIAPMGYSDLADHILRITPVMKATDPEGFNKRLAAKGWQQRWPRLRVVR